MAFSLQKLGFNVIDCANGEEAWAKLNSDEAKDVVALFSDIMMPKLSGMKLLAKVRAEERWKKLPVVLVSAVNDRTSVLEARDLGVVGYLIKPIRFEKIAQIIQQIFPDHKIEDGGYSVR